MSKGYSKSPTRPSRGELWLVNLDPVEGHEQGRTRPALVMSVNPLNHGPAQLVVIVPMTTTCRNNPLHVKVAKGQGGLQEDSYILCEQIRAISLKRFIKPYQTVEPVVMNAVEDKLQIILGL